MFYHLFQKQVKSTLPIVSQSGVDGVVIGNQANRAYLGRITFWKRPNSKICEYVWQRIGSSSNLRFKMFYTKFSIESI